MNSLLYLKMAVTSIRKNSRIYFPYLISIMLVSGIYYIIVSVSNMVSDSSMNGKTTMGVLLLICMYIVIILAVIILFYANSFVLKQRKKELGLYYVLGLEKKQIFQVLFWEILVTAVIGISGGIIGGALLSQLAFLGLLKLIRIPSALEFQIPFNAVGVTFQIFLPVFWGILMYDLVAVKKSNPMELLRGSKEGEKEPKVNWIMAILGLISLGAGYIVAFQIESVGQVLMRFFPAAVLVMIGTYFLFIAGSIAVLKRMKKTESFYYKPSNFISLSGMIYRMRKNAAGLASICILSTAVIITMASSLSIFLGEEDVLEMEYPRDFYAQAYLMEDYEVPDNEMKTRTEEHARKYDVTVSNPLEYVELYLPVLEEDGKYNSFFEEKEKQKYTHLAVISCTTAEYYQKNTGKTAELKENEVIICREKGKAPEEYFQIDDMAFDIKEVVSDVDMEKGMNVAAWSVNTSFQVVVKDIKILKKIQNMIQTHLNEEKGGTVLVCSYYYYFDLEGKKENISHFFENYRDSLNGIDHLAITASRQVDFESFYSFYGSVIFIGLFMVLMFLIATVLIIYYKQITEGYDDKERFLIMQKVGLGDNEVKRTIQKQILQVFFLPLLVAILHMAAAYKALVFMMKAFTMYNERLFAECLVITVFFFCMIYFAIYLLTAKNYYQIVRRRNEV